MSFRLNQSVIRDPRGRIKYKRFPNGKYDHYHIGLWLEADDEREMERVESVEYELHPSFRNRYRRSKNRENDFSITFWSWGTFRVQARIRLAGEPAETISVVHDLDYALPDDDGTNYVSVDSGESPA